MFGTRLNHETRLFMDREEVSGIDSASLQYTHVLQTTRFLGYNSGVQTLEGPTQGNLNLTRYLIYDDPLLSSYSGDMWEGSGSIHYGGEVYGFSGLYLTDYSVNCAVGSVPNVNADFIIFGELLAGHNASGTFPVPPVDIPTQGSISIVCDGSSSNRVVGFDYTMKMKREPHYSIGKGSQASPDSVDSPTPVEYSAQVQIEVDDLVMEDSFDPIITNRDVSLTVEGREGAALGTFNVPNATLVSQNISQSSNGVLTMNLNYKGVD